MSSVARALRAGGLYFDGIDDYASVPRFSPSVSASNFTITFWLNLARHNVQQNFLRVGQSGTDRRVVPYVSLTNYLSLWDNFGGSIHNQASNAVLRICTWYFIAVVYRNSVKEMYLNAQRVIQYDLGFSPTEKLDSLIRIGSDTGFAYTNGIIDKVRIYNRALSADEIKAIYERDELIRDGLVLYLDFTEYEGSIAYDKSGCGNHATIYGARWVIKKQLRTLPETG